MQPSELQQTITGEQLAAMGNIGRCELIAGQIVTYHPNYWVHGKCTATLAFYLHSFILEHNIGNILIGGVGIYIRRNPDTIRAADVLYISHERMAQVQSQSFLDVAPELVVEVLSPDDRWLEVQQKIIDYFQAGVTQVWMAAPAHQTVSVYRSHSDVTMFNAGDTLISQDMLPGFSITVNLLFG